MYKRQGYNYTKAKLHAMVRPRLINTTSIQRLLAHHNVRRVGVLLIDTEGLDCAIIAAQDWSSPVLCSLNPRVIIYEKKFCSQQLARRARAALLATRKCASGGDDASQQYAVVGQDAENIAFVRGDRPGVPARAARGRVR